MSQKAPKVWPKLTVVLEKASLETIKTKKGYELLCADTHSKILKKNNKNAADYRPDIVHGALLVLLDSPLNKAGQLQIYVHTNKNVLIEINPKVRIPRTYKRFAGLMVQLLHKLKIRATDGPEVLLKTIKTPVTQHFPPGAYKIGTSVTADLVEMKEVCTSLPDVPIVFMFGSHAHGPADVDWVDKRIAVSAYPLSAMTAISRVVHSFEQHLNII